MAYEEPVREHEVYFAVLAEQAERYDDMAEHMKAAAMLENELSDTERNLLAVAYKQAIGQRRTAWRIIANAERVEQDKGNDQYAAKARAYRKRVESELRQMCGDILAVLTNHLIPNTENSESLVTYHKAQGDYHRYIAEICDDSEKTREKTWAKQAYEDGTKIAEDKLPVTNNIRLGLALNQAVFYYETMDLPQEAIAIARKAYEDAIQEAENLEEGDAQAASIVMQLMRDNLQLWAADATVRND